MNVEIKEQWVAALESGEYKQCHETLRNHFGYCCLGVLTDLYVKAHPDSASWALVDGDGDYSVEADIVKKSVPVGTESDSMRLLPRIRDWAGLKTVNPSAPGAGILSRLNDSGTTFPEIAQMIKERL